MERRWMRNRLSAINRPIPQQLTIRNVPCLVSSSLLFLTSFLTSTKSPPVLGPEMTYAKKHIKRVLSRKKFPTQDSKEVSLVYIERITLAR